MNWEGLSEKRVNQLKRLHQKTKVHGMHKSQEYQAWADMKRRCMCDSAANFHSYGGRGIKVCERWMSFLCFIEDMGKKPVGYSLERIDVNGDYEPSNCKWILRKEQAKNLRKTMRVTHGGRTQHLRAWAREIGIESKTLWSYVKKYGDEAGISKGIQRSQVCI
jgi:hypothetical protein